MGSLTPLVAHSITRCVEGSSATRVDIPIPLMVLAIQSTAFMLKESVSHMAPLANISGPLLLALMNRLVPIDALASLGTVLFNAIFPHLWARTTFVNQA